MSAHDVIKQELETVAGFDTITTYAQRVLDALKRSGYAVVELPTVAHKGPNDTDASMFRRAAKNLEDGRYIGGGNLQAAIIRLLRSAADAAERA
jgi:hypothetical protein